MLSINDVFYNDKQEQVLVYGKPDDRSRSHFRKGYLSRQDSRNFRSSALPPPLRSHHHASSWFGLRKLSQSPPRSRHHAYEEHYSDYRRSKYGRSPERSSRSWFGHNRRDSRSPPRGSSYYNSHGHTKYKEDYTGYPQGSGYTAENGYAEDNYRSRHGHGYSSYAYSTGVPYVSSKMYHGQSTATIPRTYQAAYSSANVYGNQYMEMVKLKVPLCYEACERITNHMLALEGVDSVTCDQMKQKVTVRGTASPADILRQGKECFRQTTFWRS